MRLLPNRAYALLSALASAACTLPALAQTAPEPTLELIHQLEPSDSCATCHSFHNRKERSAELSYAPYAWQGTLMANAARDPVFWAAVALAAQDDPAHTDACIRCHSPRAFTQGRKFATHPSELLRQDFDGVGCDVCHRMDGAKDLHLGNALFHLDDLLPEGAEKPAKRGPWSYHNQEVTNLDHAWSQDNHFMGSSEACGTCHNVTTPRPWVDLAGNTIGAGFPEQRTYSEWKHSSFAKAGSAEFRSCQDCHMQAVADVAGSRVLEQDGPRHATGGRHHQFAGANVPMLEFLKHKFGSKGSFILPDKPFEDAIQANKNQLARAAKLTLMAPTQVDLSQGLRTVALRVENLSGHKLPTGYSEGRIMWVELTARYRGQIVYQSGLWDPATRSISQDPQLRTYEGIAQEAHTGQKFHLLKNNQWLSDTRIPPKGLAPHPDTDPRTDRYPLLNGVWAHYDQIVFDFPEPSVIPDQSPQDSGDDQLEITARLLYWINTDVYIDLLARDNLRNDLGRTLAAEWKAFPKNAPMELSQATATIPIVAFAGPSEDSGCGCRSARKQAMGFSALALLALLSLRRRERFRSH